MDDYIAHRRSGLHYETKASHKYYKRVPTGDKKKPYIYFYTKAQYDAYLKQGSKPKRKTTSPKKRRKVLDTIRSVLNEAVDSFKRVVDSDGNGKWDLVDNIEKSSKEKPRKTQREKPKSTSTSKQSSLNAGHTSPPKDHKYIAKLQINGKYRYFYTEAELNSYYNRDPAAKSERDVMSHFDLITTPETDSESQSQINKNYKKTANGVSRDPGYTNNCYSCTLAYEARKRGYDVSAISDTNGGSTKEISSFYEGVSNPLKFGNRFNKNSGWDFAPADGYDSAKSGRESLNDTADLLNSKYPDGARGNLNVYWRGGGGHSVAWEKQDGEIYIHDSQNNTTYKMKEASFAGNIAPNGVLALRTDDKTLTKNAAKYLESNKEG